MKIRRTVHVLMRTFAAMLASLAVLLLAVNFTSANDVTENVVSPGWHGPVDQVVSPCGRTAWIIMADSQQLAEYDTKSKQIVRRMQLNARPNAIVIDHPALSSIADDRPGPNTPPAEKQKRKIENPTLYLACGGVNDGQVLIITPDRSELKIKTSIPVGHTPSGLAVSPDSQTLYVANRFDNTISVIDLSTRECRAEWPVPREPIDIALTPDSRKLLVANHLSTDTGNEYFTAAKISIIDTQSGQSTDVVLPSGSNSLRRICITPDGRLALVTHVVANFLAIPFQVTSGWTNRNAVSVIDIEKQRMAVTILLDNYDLGAGNPWDVECSDDGQLIVATTAGSDELMLIDAQKMFEQLHIQIFERPIPGGVVLSPSYLGNLRRRITLPVKGPRGLAIHDHTAIVSGYFSDTLCTVDLDQMFCDEPNPEPGEQKPVPIQLGPTPKMTPERLGEQLFHDATICFEHWQSCTSCHPDARSDGINWDLLNDGSGNPKNSKSMLYSHRTPPSMASGVRDTAEIAVRSGIHHILFANRPESEAVAMDAYLKSLRPVPSPRLVNGKLSESAERGKKLFESPRIGCAVCHSGPLYTDQKMHDVNSYDIGDFRDDFDTPTLIEAWRTAPYMHNGSFTTIRQLLQEGDHGNYRKQLDRLSPQQVDDLVEFTESL